ncbi:hypothetical protein BC938DRAFT_476052, partial [Jimgerdemannia flammicorona]
ISFFIASLPLHHPKQFLVVLPTVFAALNIFVAAQLPPPSTFNRYTRFWYSSSNAYKWIAMLLTFVSYTEVLIEMGVQKKWGTKAKWRLFSPSRATWYPWLLSLSMELASRGATRHHFSSPYDSFRTTMSQLEKEEASRRIHESKPIISLIAGVIRDYQPLWDAWWAGATRRGVGDGKEGC